MLCSGTLRDTRAGCCVVGRPRVDDLENPKVDPAMQILFNAADGRRIDLWQISIDVEAQID
jgi:hypothetical protein